MPFKLMDETAIYLAPGTNTALTPGRLLTSAGSFLAHIPASAPDALLFRVSTTGFLFEAEIVNGRVIMRRNGKEVSCKLAAEQPPPSTQGPPPTLLLWLPGMLKMFTVEEKNETATPATFVPHSLIEWAQRESISPVLHYESPQDFFGTVVAVLAGVQDKIVETSMQGAFWDETRGAHGRIEKRVPKREVEIQPTIEGLLRDVGIAKSFKVLREPMSAGGALDFYFIGALKTGGVVGVCMELKHAHSQAIFDGLEKQLPAYMKNKGAEFGVYGVLWFKSDEFDEPNQDKLLFGAELHRRRLLLPNHIVIETFDLTKPVPPSGL
jgi:hypothetical protein